VAAVGLQVVEAGQPARRSRRGRGKSDVIDAHLALLAALRLDVDRLPLPRSKTNQGLFGRASSVGWPYLAQYASVTIARGMDWLPQPDAQGVTVDVRDPRWTD
jgi:hypothetical protein